MYRHFKNVCNTERIASWESKGLSDETINHLITTSGNSFAPALSYIGNKTRLNFDLGFSK